MWTAKERKNTKFHTCICGSTGLIQTVMLSSYPIWCARVCALSSSSSSSVSRHKVRSGSNPAPHLPLMAGHGIASYGGTSCRHRYMPIEEHTEEANHTPTPSTAACRWLGLAAALMLSAVLLGRSLNTTRSAVSSSENLGLREGRSAVNLHSDVVELVR